MISSESVFMVSPKDLFSWITFSQVFSKVGSLVHSVIFGGITLSEIFSIVPWFIMPSGGLFGSTFDLPLFNFFLLFLQRSISSNLVLSLFLFIPLEFGFLLPLHLLARLKIYSCINSDLKRTTPGTKVSHKNNKKRRTWVGTWIEY